MSGAGHQGEGRQTVQDDGLRPGRAGGEARGRSAAAVDMRDTFTQAQAEQLWD